MARMEQVIDRGGVVEWTQVTRHEGSTQLGDDRVTSLGNDCHVVGEDCRPGFDSALEGRRKGSLNMESKDMLDVLEERRREIGVLAISLGPALPRGRVEKVRKAEELAEEEGLLGVIDHNREQEAEVAHSMVEIPAGVAFPPRMEFGRT